LTGARLFLRHSQGVDTAVIRMPTPADSKPLLLETFCRWMREHRGTSELTLYNYGLPIQELIRRLGDDPSKLDAKRLRKFVLTQSRNVGWATAKRCTTPLSDRRRTVSRRSARRHSRIGPLAIEFTATIPAVGSRGTYYCRL
jgi:hypothetical protein